MDVAVHPIGTDLTERPGGQTSLIKIEVDESATDRYAIVCPDGPILRRRGQIRPEKVNGEALETALLFLRNHRELDEVRILGLLDS